MTKKPNTVTETVTRRPRDAREEEIRELKKGMVKLQEYWTMVSNELDTLIEATTSAAVDVSDKK